MPSLSPPPKFAVTFLDDDGVFQPAIGYKLYTYAATTSTPKDTYTSIGMGAANTNPIILDARGECDLWLNGSYKFILKDDLDQTIWTVDEIRDPTSSPSFANATLTGTLTISSTAVTWSGNPTHSGNHTFSGNVTVNGNTTLGNASSDTLTITGTTVSWPNNAIHTGNQSIVGNASVSGTLSVAGNTTLAGTLDDPNGPHTDGFWTPTVTPGTNCASATPSVGQFMQLGLAVIASVTIDIDPTAGSTTTEVSFTLPSPGTISTIFQIIGHGADNTGTNQGTIFGFSNDAKYRFISAGTSTVTHWLFFMYRLDEP